jgi:hypothetical protein
MGFFDWLGDMTGFGQANTANDQNSRSFQNWDAAAGSLKGGADTSATQFAKESGEAGNALGEQMGSDAATAGTQKATQAARTSGLNKGQAALVGSQQAGSLYTQGKAMGQGMGMNAYGQGAGNKVNAAANLGNIGTNQANAGSESTGQSTKAGGALLGGLGVLFSDKNVKTDVKASPDIESIMKKIKPESFKYKPEIQQGEGEHVGVIAQDLEKTPLKENVVDTPAGKMINPAKQENSNLNLIIQLAAKVHELQGKLGEDK